MDETVWEYKRQRGVLRVQMRRDSKGRMQLIELWVRRAGLGCGVCVCLGGGLQRSCLGKSAEERVPRWNTDKEQGEVMTWAIVERCLRREVEQRRLQER